MLSLLSRFNLLNILLITANIVYALIDDATADELFNLTWILVVGVYFLVPRLLYQRKYLAFFSGFVAILLIGVLIMEIVIEGDAEFSDFLKLWTWTHELPLLLWPFLLTISVKVAVDLTLKQNLMVDMEKERAKSEIRFLKSQLSPHVLFNNLNNIYSFALHKSSDTPKLILKLSEIMRYMLYEANQDKVPLEKELAHVDDYVELQRIQLENRGELMYEKEGNPSTLMIAPMMLISFVENCFKHASATSVDDLKILIKVEITGSTIDLYLENSHQKKLEADEEESLQEGGIGLKNVKRRLELLYPDTYSLIIKELSDRFIVNLSIQLEKELP